MPKTEDVLEWLRGLIAALVQGGATAVTGAVTVGMGDPYYELGSPASLTLIWRLFVVSAILGGMAFLRNRPVPEQHK